MLILFGSWTLTRGRFWPLEIIFNFICYFKFYLIFMWTGEFVCLHCQLTLGILRLGSLTRDIELAFRMFEIVFHVSFNIIVYFERFIGILFIREVCLGNIRLTCVYFSASLDILITYWAVIESSFCPSFIKIHEIHEIFACWLGRKLICDLLEIWTALSMTGCSRFLVVALVGEKFFG